MKLSNSTKRALRTAVHVAVAIAAVIPNLVAGLPIAADLGQVLAVAIVVSKAHNALEASGALPKWLQDESDPTEVESAVDKAVAVAPAVEADAVKVVEDVAHKDVPAAIADGTAAVDAAKTASQPVEGDAAP